MARHLDERTLRVVGWIATVTAIRVGPQPAELFEVPPGWRVVSEKP